MPGKHNAGCCNCGPPPYECDICQAGTTPAGGWEVDIAAVAAGLGCFSGCDHLIRTYAVETRISECEWKDSFSLGIENCASNVDVSVTMGPLGGGGYGLTIVLDDTSLAYPLAMWTLEWEELPDCSAIDDDAALDSYGTGAYYCDCSAATCHITAVP